MNDNNSSSKEYADLTPIQQQRYDLLFEIYGYTTASIVTNIHGKGANSWPNFLEKMDAMEQAKKPLKDYYEALYDVFELYGTYTPGQIIGNVATVRRQLGLPQYTERIKAQSENDFSAIFLYKELSEKQAEDGKERKVFLGYQPLARIKV